MKTRNISIVGNLSIKDEINESILTDREQRIYDFLQSTPITVLSTVNKGGQPRGSVVYYTLTREFVFSFMTKIETVKYKNLMQNQHVMMTVFDPKSQTTAQISGIATPIHNGTQIDAIARANMSASLQTGDGDIPPIAKLEAGKHVAFTVKPSLVTMAVYARPESGDYSETFESLESFELEHAGIKQR